jgi:hypothetical protein
MISTTACAEAKTAPAPVVVRSVSLHGPAGRLEALVNEGTAEAGFAALVCHPHPQGGGTMHNKVVYHAMKVLNDPAWGLGAPVLRFNFRGTGLSEGEFDGRAEAGDAVAAMEWLVNEYNRPLVVAGFSFGAMMALEACCGSTQYSQPIRALALLGLPTQIETSEFSNQPVARVQIAEKRPSGAKAHTFFSAPCGTTKVVPFQNQTFPTGCYPCLKDCKIPKLFLSGANDQYAPAAQLEHVYASASDPKQQVLLPRADHFFTGQLEPMQQALAGWLKEHLL